MEKFQDGYYSTYYNKNSKYNKGIVNNELDFMTSLGTEGIIKREFAVRRTEITKSFVRTTEMGQPINGLKSYLNYTEIKEILDSEKIESHYTEFTIAKRSGGKRTILSPSDSLKSAQRYIMNIFQGWFKLLEHNAAHAYVSGRSIKTNASVHKDNYNFVNIDLSDFFPSIKRNDIIEALNRNSATAGFMIELQDYPKVKDSMLDLLLYEGGLPQGAPSSPFFSNIVMVAFDYHMEKLLKERHRDILYTRYADDMTFSSKLTIKANTILELIKEVATLAYGQDNFIKVNPNKTRTTTYRGKNRVTGVKINAENNLSIGWKEKQTLKTDMVSIIIRAKRNEPISKEQIEQTVGMFSYLSSIEPGYASYLLRQWSVKFNISQIPRFLSRYKNTY